MEINPNFVLEACPICRGNVFVVHEGGWNVQVEPGMLQLVARLCCQNPTLNPAQMVAAIQLYLPDFTPDFTKCSRLEILDAQEDIFR